jgi:Family of unknown function (DUF6982)
VESGGSTSKWEKVIVRLVSHSVRGYVEAPDWKTIEDVLDWSLPGVEDSLRVRRLDSDAIEQMPIDDVKAVFYVRSFDGDPSRDHINFHTPNKPIVPGIWMRLKFYDGEVMEGVVHNSMRYLVEPGFFIVPTDPGSNNRLAYVFKKHLVEHCVLGLCKI